MLPQTAPCSFQFFGSHNQRICLCFPNPSTHKRRGTKLTKPIAAHMTSPASAVHCVVTMAEVEPSNKFYLARTSEYMFALHKILSYKFPITLVVSETSKVQKLTVQPIQSMFHTIFNIPSTAQLGAHSKSQQETFSLQSWMKNTPKLNDDIWIIKLSGRYLLLDDTFVQHVITAPKDIICVAKICPSNTHVSTFCFAMRYGWYRKFLLEYVPKHLGPHVCVETAMVDFLRAELQLANTKFVERLGVLTNTANENKFQVI